MLLRESPQMLLIIAKAPVTVDKNSDEKSFVRTRPISDEELKEQNTHQVVTGSDFSSEGVRTRTTNLLFKIIFFSAEQKRSGVYQTWMLSVSYV